MGRYMTLRKFALIVILFSSFVPAEALNCDFSGYKAVDGVRAEAKGNVVSVSWQGEGGQQLRAEFSLHEDQPVVQELSARSGSSGTWVVLGKDLTPDFQVTTGKRRISGGLVSLLKAANLDSPEEEERRKWNIFWDVSISGKCQ